LNSKDSLRDARVLITGGAGLIGSHLADRLVAASVGELIIYDNFSRGRRENLAASSGSARVTTIEADIRDRDALRKALEGVDLAFHLAAIRLTQCAEEPRLAQEVMVDGAFNVAEAVVEAKVPKLVAASSASIYGMAESFPTREDHHPYDNNTFYGAAKVFNEGLYRSFEEMYGLNYVALRPFNVYGPRMDIHGKYTEVLIRWMERIAAGQPPLIFGDGKQSMDFVYVGDVARAFELAAIADAPGEVCNIASGVETSLEQLARSLLKVMNSDLGVEYGPVRALTAVPRRLADTARAEQVLGFKATVNLEDGLKKLVEWWRKQ